MKHRDLLKRIAQESRQQGVEWRMVRRGANHDVHALEGLIIPIPRHTEIGERVALEIFKECEPILGVRWWK